ncbi:MAG: hypothetical protein WCJ07_06465 [Verrucomicrobiota bacterium]
MREKAKIRKVEIRLTQRRKDKCKEGEAEGEDGSWQLAGTNRESGKRKPIKKNKENRKAGIISCRDRTGGEIILNRETREIKKYQYPEARNQENKKDHGLQTTMGTNIQHLTPKGNDGK